jgi:phosphatidylglycerol:prolipoprotein diacylglycerol transferase
MYPDFQHLFEGIFKADGPSFLAAIKTFGFFVAIAFLAGAWILSRELRRKERLGQLQPQILPHSKAKKYLDKQRKLDESIENVLVYHHQRTGEIVILALIAGLVGAKIFNALETWKDFINDPIRNLFSGGGLTFYGGLIVASIAIYFYCKRHNIHFIHLCDAMAPTLMLAYAIGRLGCHFSGDGDWGIFNSAYISLPDGSLKLATSSEFQQIVSENTVYFRANFDSAIPSVHLVAPDHLPTWLYAMNFPHNVIGEGVPIDKCSGKYCSMLPVSVFPTSLYEAFICLLLFMLIWGLRKRFKYALHLFGFYLILNGLERFFIEKIKVNYKYDWGFIHPAQSEIISVLLVIIGSLILIFYRRPITLSDPGKAASIK